MDDLRVVLVAPRNPLNIGAAARAMANFGFTGLRLVNPYEVAFQEARSAVGAGPVLAAAQPYPSIAEAVADCTLVVGTTSGEHRAPRHSVRRLETAAWLIRLHPGPVALLFGSEKYGLSNEDMSHCHWLLRIGMAEAEQSMNLGQAVAVCLYELRRAEPDEARLATAGENEQITQRLLEALRASGYVNPLTERSTEEKARRLVRRLRITAHDAPLLLGMLRQILWRLNDAPPPRD